MDFITTLPQVGNKYILPITYQINKLENLFVPAKDSVSSCKKVRTGERVSLDLLLLVVDGLEVAEVAFGGT